MDESMIMSWESVNQKSIMVFTKCYKNNSLEINFSFSLAINYKTRKSINLITIEYAALF